MKYSTIIFFLLSSNTFAKIPDYNAPVILARSNINDGFNLPPMSFLQNASPVINDEGDIAFKVATINGENLQGLWIKTYKDENGKILYKAPNERLVTDPSINKYGKIAFNLFDEGVTDGLFVYDAINFKLEQVLDSKNLPILNYTYPTITDNDEIYFRGTDNDNNRTFFLFNSKLNQLMSEGNNTSYLFRPAINNNHFLASKVRLGPKGQWDENSPDHIILFDGEASRIIAEDRDSNPASTFLSFGNSLSLSDSGLIAFTGSIEKNQRGIFLYDDGNIINIALEGKDNISEIETFSAKVNDDGLVLFRAKDKLGRRALFLGDTNGVKQLISEGDEIESDLGKSKILFNQFFPGFGGEIDMNSDGDIVFNCVLVRAHDDRELGQAIYKLSVKK